MLKKSLKIIIALTWAITGASCTMISSNDLKVLRQSIEEIKKIDNYYLTPCDIPPVIDSKSAELSEVVTVYYTTLNFYLECYHKHKNLVEQIK